MTTRSAVLLGASGLVGGHLLRLLTGDPAYAVIKAFTRRPLELSGDTVREVVVDFDHPESYRGHLAGVDDVFCCLGTTIKAAGSQKAFRKVDFEAPVAVARESRAAGADVARAMHAAASRDVGGVHVYEGESLLELARSSEK
jgi:uncharacterized protein YbjT (DUF2867 family)